MNLQKATLQYCLDTYEIEGRTAIISNGELLGFQEEIPTQTANPSGDK